MVERSDAALGHDAAGAGRRRVIDGSRTASLTWRCRRSLTGQAISISIIADSRTSRAMADEAETERVTFTIANPRTVNSKSLYALVDVEVQVAGLSFVIVGVQVRRGSGGLSARLPTHRDVNGAWRPVVEMPEELLRPLGNAVMEFLAEEGLAERRSALTKQLSYPPHQG